MADRARWGGPGAWLACLLASWLAFAPAAAMDRGQALKALDDAGLAPAAAGILVERWQALDAGSLDPLVALVQSAVEQGAPAELVADKALEGLAKRVPPARLFPALERWSTTMGQAAAMARELRQELEPGEVSEREAALRLSILIDRPGGRERLARLRERAARTGADLSALLGVGEAMGQLAAMGADEPVVAELGALLLDKGLRPADIGRFLRVIELAGPGPPASQAAKRVSEALHKDRNHEDLLQELQAELPADAAAGGPGQGQARGAGAAADKANAASPGTDQERATGPPTTTGPPASAGERGRADERGGGRGEENRTERGRGN